MPVLHRISSSMAVLLFIIFNSLLTTSVVYKKINFTKVHCQITHL